MTLPPYNPPPPVKEGRGPLFWLALGCGGCFTGLIVFVVTVFFFAMMVLRQAEPVREALRMARADERVIAVFGKPLDPGFTILGNLNANDEKGHADIRMSIHGPKSKGTLHFVAVMENHHWTYQSLTVSPDDGESIDLLSKSSDGEPPGGP